MSSTADNVDLNPPLAVVDANNLSLLKLVQASILVALLLKISYFLRYDQIHQVFPLSVPFFPVWLQSLVVLRAAWLMACISSGLALCARTQRGVVVVTLINFVALCILSVHQKSFNDVTFMCCAWSALWCVWMATRLHEPFDSLFPRAVWLTHVILSMIFLGGAVGKMTDGYWSGQVLYEIYFADRHFWSYNLIRRFVPDEQLFNVAMWHSRLVIFAEWCCAFLWLLPPRVASVLAIIMLCGIALTNNFLLFSVVTSLLGLALVGLHQKKNRTSGTTGKSATGA